MLRQVTENRMKKAGQVDEAVLDQIETDTRAAMEERSHALANTARLWDDGLIDPRDTRPIVCEFVAMAQNVLKTQLGPTAGQSYRP